MYTSSERWVAARRVFELFPETAEELDICLKVSPGRVRRRAFINGWKNADDGTQPVRQPKQKPKPDTADKALNDGSFANMANRFSALVRRELAKLEKCEANDDNPLITELTGLARSIMTLSEMHKKAEAAADERQADNQDLLEIHGRLARKIEAIVKRENGE